MLGCQQTTHQLRIGIHLVVMHPGVRHECSFQRSAAQRSTGLTPAPPACNAGFRARPAPFGHSRSRSRTSAECPVPKRLAACRSARLAIRLPFGMLITTAFDFPGYETVAVQGEIFGLTVRARNIGSGCAAGLRSIFGGEIPQLTKLLAQSRNEAMARIIEEARMRGSNAIVAMRFDSGAI